LSADDPPDRGGEAVPPVVEVHGSIKLGQFLKFSGLATTGGEAKAHIDAGAVRVNGAVEARRGRKLVDGDVVSLGCTVRRVSVPQPLVPPSRRR
jgi:ribosome-associated protein